MRIAPLHVWLRMSLLAVLLMVGRAEAGSIGGSVTLLGNGQPAIGTRVVLYRSSFFGDELLEEHLIDAGGSYDFDVHPGNLRVVASLADHVTVASFLGAPSAPLTRNFQMSLPSSIQLLVRDAGSLAPVTGVRARLEPVGFDGNAGGTTSGTGALAWSGIAGGPYRICIVEPNDAYLNECFDGYHLPPGDNPSGAPTTLLGSGQQLMVTIDLDPGARITGTAMDTYRQAPVQGPLVMSLYDSSGNFQNDVNTTADANGLYAVTGLPPGDYYLQASGMGAHYYSRQLYPAIPCWGGCDPTDGTLLTTTGTSTVPGIDFTLHPGAVATGRVTDSVTGTALAGVTVTGLQELGGLFLISKGSTHTLADGTYTLAHMDGAGLFHIGAGGVPDHVSESWPDTPCYVPQCYGGKAQVFAADQVRSGFDFALDPGGAISGAIRDTNGVDLDASVYIRNEDNTVTSFLLRGGSPNPGYATDGLPPGTYYAAASRSHLYTTQCQAYAGRECSSLSGFNPSNATRIDIVAGTTVSGIDFTFNDDERFRGSFED